MQAGAYSFQDVQATISGPGGSFSIGAGAGNAEEGIVIAQAEDKNTMMPGADGSVMHSLHAGKHGTITITLLKTSPYNQMLNGMYNFQSPTSANWGRNLITVRNPVSGDALTGRYCAFKKRPDITYAKDGNTMAWAFDVGAIDTVLGNGSPSL